MAHTASASNGAAIARTIAGTLLLGGFTLAMLLGLVAVLAMGSPFYLAPSALHGAHPLAKDFASGRPIGLMLGLTGTFLMVALLVYSARKWLPFLSFLGTNRSWMSFHLICGLLGPFYILLHAEMKLPSGFIGIGFWCMVLVALSGFFGRYLFGWFPQSAADLKADLAATHQKLGELRTELVAETRGAAADAVARAVELAKEIELQPRTLGELIVLDADVRRRQDLIRILLHRARLSPDVHRAAEAALVEQLELRRSMAGFDVARRLLRYWSLLHQPLAMAMYLIVAVHVVNAVVFGGSIGVLLGGP